MQVKNQNPIAKPSAFDLGQGWFLYLSVDGSAIFLNQKTGVSISLAASSMETLKRLIRVNYVPRNVVEA